MTRQRRDGTDLTSTAARQWEYMREEQKMAAAKPKKVLVCVLTGLERTNWINPALMSNLLHMATDRRFEVHFDFPIDYRPFEFARNYTIHSARTLKADWLISFDNDNFLADGGSALDIIAAAGEDKHVIGLTYGVGRAPDCAYFPAGNHGPIDGAFREEQSVSGGALIIRRTVWEKIPRGPWFKWVHADNELLAPDLGGAPEDGYFCRLVREHGFKVWTHLDIVAGHFKTGDATRVAAALNESAGVLGF